jgi:molybdopterin synthase sulfur carrier subunit
MSSTPGVVVDLVYLARLREEFGRAGERLELPRSVRTVGELRTLLAARGPVWSGELAPGRAVRIAVNHSLAEGSVPLAAGDEVAFFPPVTGG